MGGRGRREKENARQSLHEGIFFCILYEKTNKQTKKAPPSQTPEYLAKSLKNKEKQTNKKIEVSYVVQNMPTFGKFKFITQKQTIGQLAGRISKLVSPSSFNLKGKDPAYCKR